MPDLKVYPDRLRAIAGEWDILGPIRHRLISSGLDPSFDRILSPYVIKSISGKKIDRLFDGGCGTGDLTFRLAQHANSVDAVDISEKSIEIARSDNAAPNIDYCCASIETFANSGSRVYDACVANMLLMDTPDAMRVLSSIKTLLKSGGYLIITVLHPFFYDFVHDKNSNLERYLENRHSLDQFAVTGYRGDVVLRSHFHRPISGYIKTLCRLGFTIGSLDELAPPKSLSRQYGDVARYPRFLGIRARARLRGS